MNEIVLIGKITGSTPNLIEMEYPSVAGINSIRLPRTMVARFERIEGGRVAVLVRPDDSNKGQELNRELISQNAPLHVTSEHMNIVTAFENNENISNDADFDDEVPVWANQDVPSVEVNGQAAGPFDNMLFSGGRKEKATMDWDFDPVRKPAFVMVDDGSQSTVA